MKRGMFMMPHENEQWKTDGDCNKCRRQEYCKKPCKKSRQQFVKNLLEQYINAHPKILDDDAE